MKIALLDDEIEFLEYEKRCIEEAFSLYNMKVAIDIFTNSKEFFVASENNNYKLAFLDIDMPDLSGLEVAEIIRKSNSIKDIIFVSNKEHFVFDALIYQPFQFIRKNYFSRELKNVVSALINKYRDSEKFIFVSVSGKNHKIYINDVLYFENHGHILTVHTNEQSYEYRENISSKEQELSMYYFCRVHSGFLVNLKYVSSIGKGDLILDNNKIIPISRNRIKEVKARFQEYLRERL